ncbi:BlaI/MecI/CopY family transcriptional regulator [Streptomyces sp. SID8370]|nr:BlaI/MecI/CopY family transcriptional regulator [Streptomyces sp. SID8370]MYW88352.1 BlaI/MecI/CopY family transcriptional regulator [Streptomyces sp. SID8371]PJT51583.1 transcriptional regulator [Streptomyces albidoflavus]QHC16260.1 BlaI/MecI/CopY family transcriptional regulator [Streptomyces sp. GF20]RZD65355.1 BlaI/MecI/CopY family transcriptional regulator [Streptomyces albidoflavus]
MPRPLGELEDAVMTRVWKWNRPVTVREVLEDLQQERSIAYTTVMTVMDNLYQKGWVRREAEGRAYRYAAVSTRAAYAAALMNEAWQRSDNQAAALVAFFGMMSPEQRDALGDAMRVIQLPAEEPREVPAPPEGAEGAEESEGAEEAGEAAEAGEEQDSPEPAQDSGAPSAPGAAAELPESEGGAAGAGGGR